MSGNVGQIVEIRWWFNAEDPQDRALSKRHLADLMAAMAFSDGVILGPVSFDVIGIEQVGPPPDNFPGTPKCLCAISGIVGLRSFSRFTLELEDEDLERLRGYTRMEANEYLSDEACDEIINEYGPEVAMKTVH